MEITKQALDIHQDTSREQFRFDMKGDEDVYMQYHIHTDPNPNVLEIKKTYVPEVLSGVDIDEKMAMEAVRFAEKMGYKIKTTCSFMSGWMNRHPEFAGMRTK
ncbi:MAG: N-acetyltransferase [bacterium]|jgi:predicted GNAT family acetyltransferase|nr:N-acetyltransferase [bacterium]